MERSGLTARQLYADLGRSGGRVRYRLGRRPALINVDLQRAYTDARFATAYAPPEQLLRVASLSRSARHIGALVVWTYVAFEASGEDCGIWGTRSDTPDSLQNIRDGSQRAELDYRLGVDVERDIVIRKRMPSAFFQTHLASLLVHHGVDTIVLTGGSTSGCLRATAVDAISHGYPTLVVEDAVSDKHESPHFAALYDLAIKYVDVRPTAAVQAYLETGLYGAKATNSGIGA